MPVDTEVKTDILLIDDDQGMRETLKDILEGEGYRISPFASGKDAVKEIRKGLFDIVIVDLKLPDIGGMKILEESKEVNPESAVIVMTGYASLESAVEALNRGAFSYIIKPFNMDEVKVVIKKAMHQIRLSKENQRLIDELQLSSRKLEKTINELKKTQEQLIQAGKMCALGQLGAGAAHEINNPLAGIIGFTEAILSDLKNQRFTPDEIAHDLQIVLKNAERCKTIIGNLLTFARAKEPEKRETDINSLLNDALSFVEYKTRIQDIKVVKRYGENLCKVNIDRDQMTQVFINIISNAQNAMPDRGELLVMTWLENNFVGIEFKDTGIGIEKESLPKVFDPFFTTYRPGKGVGLGLSISYSIIKRHEGSIEVNSEGKNKGASFIIKIPV